MTAHCPGLTSSIHDCSLSRLDTHTWLLTVQAWYMTAHCPGLIHDCSLSRLDTWLLTVQAWYMTTHQAWYTYMIAHCPGLIHDCSLSRLDTCTSMKSERVNLVLWTYTIYIPLNDAVMHAFHVWVKCQNGEDDKYLKIPKR
jgi:hypothetical protein